MRIKTAGYVIPFMGCPIEVFYNGAQPYFAVDEIEAAVGHKLQFVHGVVSTPSKRCFVDLGDLRVAMPSVPQEQRLTYFAEVLFLARLHQQAMQKEIDLSHQAAAARSEAYSRAYAFARQGLRPEEIKSLLADEYPEYDSLDDAAHEERMARRRRNRAHPWLRDSLRSLAIADAS